MKYFKRMSFKKKLVVAFLVLIIGNVLICAYYALHMRTVINTNQQIQESYSAVWEISSELNIANDQIDLYVETGSEEALAAYEASRDFVKDSLEVLEYSTEDVEEIFVLRAIRNSTDTLFRLYDQSIVSIQNESPYYYTSYYEGSKIAEYSYGYFDEYIDLLLETNTARIDIIKQETEVTFFSVQILIVVFGIIYMIFASIFSGWISKPINQLVKAASRISEGDYDFEDLTIINESEVGELTATFNIMKADISQAIQVLEGQVEMEKQLHEAELKEIKSAELLKEAQYLALQSQMNPHFLFNTLNAISRSIQLAPTEVSVNLVHSLATICRYNLDHVNTYSTIEEELYVTSRYIYIQQHRFEDRIQYEVVCDDSCKQKLVPSLLIQPLVENALIHGIESLEEGGKILVKVNARGNGICIRVFDNGVGMHKEHLQNIKNGINNGVKGHTTGIGLGNILQRMKLIEHGRMQIASSENKGTLIKIYMTCQ